ncbi:hypothetical protein MOQ_000298 [Trypanosoma cruzi marinkellei]|uniref:Uncharacterized protein n=1 Tax=Trypanosoma cruzi marinkellei TaxID=85056 RepID=K2NWQ0_TRYCR|nr:hypothetical protein MOQ_000298 [Trypanosoma cruzi marinkellei]
MTQKSVSASSSPTAAAAAVDYGYLLLVECRKCDGSEAFRFGAELLRWPEKVAVKVYSGGDATLPSIPVNNKYFSTKVRIVITDGNALAAENSTSEASDAEDFSLLSSLLRPQSVNKTGWVLLVDGSVHPDQIPWHRVPNSALFRVLVNFNGVDMKIKEKIWYDACVANGFEYVPHLEGYEVVPAGVERSGLLGGDYRGASRLFQILHNTMWPENCRVPNGANGDADDKQAKRRRAASTNLLAVIDDNGNDVLHWLCTKGKDRRFFTAQWPLEAGETIRKQEKNMSWNSAVGEGRKALGIANKYYTAKVEVQCLHSALLSPAMADLFLAQYADCQPKLALVSWPPTSTQQVLDGATCPQLPVLIDQLRRWGVEDCVILTRRAKESISSFDAHYSEEQGFEVVYMDDDELARVDEEAREFGTTGADRLAEIIHTIEWPQRTPTPTPQPPPSSASALTSGRRLNRVLLWACGPSTVEEERLLSRTLHMCFSVPCDHNSAAIASMTSSSMDTPVGSTIVHNRYFDATVNVYSFGGARSAIMREPEPTVEQLLTFGVVVLLTKADMSDVSTRNSIGAALEKCYAAQSASCGICDSDWLLLDEEQPDRDVTRQLCEAAEETPAYLWYVLDGDESNEALVTRVEEMLLHITSRASGVVPAGATGKLHSVSEHSSGGSSENPDAISNGKDDDLAAAFIEVLYGLADVDGATRLGEVVQQHVWPIRTMKTIEPQHEVRKEKEKKTEHDTDGVPAKERSVKEEAVAVEEAPAQLAGCELPPDYLVDPLTQRSVYVEALAVVADDKLGERGKSPRRQKELEQDLMVWMDKMKRHGHTLPRTVRQRQAEILAIKLGEHLGKLDDA